MGSRAGRDCLRTGQGEGEEEAKEQVSAHKTAGAGPVLWGWEQGGQGAGGGGIPGARTLAPAFPPLLSISSLSLFFKCHQ